MPAAMKDMRAVKTLGSLTEMIGMSMSKVPSWWRASASI